MKEQTYGYSYLPRIIDLDAVTELLYESGNLAEEVYRAVGGDAIPFYSMLGKEGGLGELLRQAASKYLRELEKVFTEAGTYTNGGNVRVKPRPLQVERLSPDKAGHRPIFQDAPSPAARDEGER